MQSKQGFYNGQILIEKRETLRGKGIGRVMIDMLCLITDKNRCLRKQKTV